MKIAITTSGKTLESPVELRFGRAPEFLVFDMETTLFTSVDNTQNLNAAQGAGIQSAGNVINAGASVLISGHCGPKAMKVLKTAGIKVYLTEGGTVREAIAAFEAGTLTEITEADVEEHWL